ncbi:nucleoside triphosphate hydrolase [Sphingomonas qilianensis]|uniref:Nucleoside triphosphate hydrolase n=1 Tax=Sphingomonas qilianensis TaxID=1736690 RepID=A0ABU9XUJ0_9SPHN
MAPLIAIIGCDGSGKSTLAADMVATLGAERPVATRYLGLGSGAIGERIKRWPLIGAALERRLARKGKQTRTRGERIPGLATALVIYNFSLLRRRRFLQVLALRRQGVTVITDRYPQIDMPGFYDGPGLSAAAARSAPVAWLAARERRLYAWMASHQPTLVIRLNIDAETAHARKPEHDIELLRQKVAVTPLLRFNGAPIVDLDSRAPYAQVRQRALDAIRAAIG